MKTLTRWYAAIWVVMIVGATPLVAQEDLPPPLGYATVSEWYSQYHVYDFTDETVRTITYPERPDAVYYGGDEHRINIPVQSPYDMAVRFELVKIADEGDEDQHSHDYDLYQLNADGTRRLILNKTSSYIVAGNWSPNGRFLYLLSDVQSNGGGTMSQYELATGRLKPLQQRMRGIDACQTGTVWCVLRQISPGEGRQQPVTLYLFNRDEGTLQNLGTSALIFTTVRWLDRSSEFLYALATDDEHFAIHRHNAESGSDDLLGIVTTQYDVGFSWSPDERWFLVQTRGKSAANDLAYRLQVFDLQQSTQNPLLVTDHYWIRLSQSSADSIRWLDNQTLMYATGDESLTLNIMTLPDGAVREVAHFEPDVYFFDHDWSPDGNWLALAASPQRNTVFQLYLVSVLGEVREVKLLDVASDAQVCIGWFPQDVYDSGKANICDMNLGEG